MLFFVVSFVKNLAPLKDIFKARSLDTDTVAQVAGHILEAYEKFSHDN